MKADAPFERLMIRGTPFAEIVFLCDTI